MQLMLPLAQYPDIGARARFVEQMVDRVSTVPGVVGAGTTQTTFMPNESMQTWMFVDGRPLDANHADSAHIRHVTPGYFRTLLVPIVARCIPPCGTFDPAAERSCDAPRLETPNLVNK